MAESSKTTSKPAPVATPEPEQAVVKEQPKETPVAKSAPAEKAPPVDPLDEVRAQYAAAKAAFSARNYGTSLELMDKVVAALPESNEALQFRSLVHFALGDDKAAAADAYAALDNGPVWNREVLAALYGDMSRYEAQLRSLQVRAAENPDSVEIHFLLAFQNLLKGDLAASETELQAILGINPEEPLAKRLLKAVRDQQQSVVGR